MSQDLSIKRRPLLTAFGTLCLTGCIFNQPDPGDLLVKNRYPEPMTIELQVEKMADNPQSVPLEDRTPDPGADPIWERVETFDVDSGERIHSSEFISESGLFHFTADADGCDPDHAWTEFHEGPEGRITEQVIYVQVFEHGGISVDAPFFD